MPGSIRTTTAPILKSANVRVMNSIPGRTISTSRSPMATPRSRSPPASASLSPSSSANVIGALTARPNRSRAPGQTIAGCEGKRCAVSRNVAAMLRLSGIGQELLRGHEERLDVRNRVGPEGLEDGPAGSETVGHPRFVAVLVQCRASFSAAHVHQQSGRRHPFELVHELPRADGELLLFKFSKD